jgi:ATP-binding cassette subfamily B (MDR/TAP) protein 1
MSALINLTFNEPILIFMKITYYFIMNNGDNANKINNETLNNRIIKGDTEQLNESQRERTVEIHNSKDKHIIETAIIYKETELTPIKTESSKPLIPIVKSTERKSVSFFKIQFFHAKWLDFLVIFFALISSAAIGAAQPLFALIYGHILNDLSRLQTNPILIDNINHQVLLFYIFAICIFVAGFSMLVLWIYNGKITSERIRTHYFRTIMQQEQGWFDASMPYEFTTKVQGQITKIDNGLGEKVSTFTLGITQVITAYAIAFSTSWKLSLVIFALLPIFLFAGYFIGKKTQEGMIKSRLSYEKAGGIAEEVLYHIKTVASFANYDYEKKRFNEKIEETYRAAKQSDVQIAIGNGILYFAFLSTYALAIGYGSYLIYLREVNSNTGLTMSTGDVITTLFAMMFGSYSIGTMAPVLKAMLEACYAASEFFNLMKRKPQIDTSRSILKPGKTEISGQITFKEVEFAYPTMKQNAQVFNKLDLSIEANKKTAIVGQSGCGKSTTLGLILRLYDIQGGQILLDYYDLKTLDIAYLRSMIGYVPQEPVLFNSSIKDNIVFGREGITDVDIKEACRKAYAEDFINRNQLGLDYLVGTKGSMLSGGQKQRIAIARAILTKPKILILDEATSALDNKSEKEVQKALDMVSQGITTIIVAHRLSTIRNADNIIVLDKGTIVEQGNHASLLELQGYYYNLVKNEIDIDTAKEAIRLDEVVGASTISEGNEDKINRPSIELKEEIMKANVKQKEVSDKYTLFNIMMENKPVVFCGAFFACCAGCSWVIHASLLGEAIAVLASQNFLFVKEQGTILSMKYMGFAFGFGLIYFFQNYLFNLQGNYLTKRYRFLVYEKYLRTDMAYYDVPSHSPGVLLNKLSQDSTLLNGVALGMFGITIEVIVSSIIGISVSLAYSWKLGLVNLGFFPILMYLSGLQWKMRNGLITVTDQELENKAANILSESICNSKTIFSYNMQDKIVDYYSSLLRNRHKAIIKGGLINGLLFGLFQLFYYGDYATMFILGANFMLDPNDPLQFDRFMKCMLVSILTSFGIGNAQQYLGDISKGKDALKSLYNVLREPVTIDPENTKDKIKVTDLKGKVEFKNVSFEYPTMPNTPIFTNLNFTIEPGQKVAFVGHSGCGKSTIIQLIERFYDSTAGEILIDEVNVKDYDLISLRKNISLVMQEPVLFKTSNLENIRYGKLDATDEAVYQIADQVEIGQFLREKNSSVPSGGEKQRLAIARAILRDPKILLLDEATSALDNEKEKLVQASLEKIMEGRTTIAIAHRLSTIEKFDIIYVMDKGEIIEFGNHEELYSKQGIYYRLYNISNQ